MRLRIPVLLLLSLSLVPFAEAGLFSSNKKKLPKPIKAVKIRPHDGARLSKLHKLQARYGPNWGRANQLLQQPQELRMMHHLVDD